MAVHLLAVFGRTLVELWTGDAVVAAQAAPLIGILAMGSALHGVMYLPYALQLAYGATALPLKINLILMIVQIPLIIILSIEYGALGGALAWLILHILYVALGTWLTHRQLLPEVGRTWLRDDVGIPLLVSAAVGYAAWQAMAAIHPSTAIAFVAAAFTGIVAVVISVWLSPHSLARIRAAFTD